MKNKKKIVWIVIAVFVPLVFDYLIFGNSFPSNISNEAWAGFLGSYIGGLCTMAAVFITIQDNNQKIKQEKEDSLEKEEKRLSVRPYLDTRCARFDQDEIVRENDRVFEIINSKTMKITNDICKTKRKSIEVTLNHENARLICIKYIVRNIGAGSAVNMTVNVNNVDEKIAIAKDETVHLLFIVQIEEDKKSNLIIKMNYGDVENRGVYEKEDHIQITIDDKNNLHAEMIECGQQEERK